MPAHRTQPAGVLEIAGGDIVIGQLRAFVCIVRLIRLEPGRGIRERQFLAALHLDAIRSPENAVAEPRAIRYRDARREFAKVQAMKNPWPVRSNSDMKIGRAK